MVRFERCAFKQRKYILTKVYVKRKLKERPFWTYTTRLVLFDWGQTVLPLTRSYEERGARLHPNIGHCYGNWAGSLSAYRALIVGLLKSITRLRGSMLFTLQLPCYTVYCGWCSMRTCTFGKQMKGRAGHYSTPKEKFNYFKPPREDVLVQIHPWQFLLKSINFRNHATPLGSGFQRARFSQRSSCTANPCAQAALSCAAWLTICDAVHVTPTLAACFFHELHSINHYWESARTEALRSNFGASFCARWGGLCFT